MTDTDDHAGELLAIAGALLEDASAHVLDAGQAARGRIAALRELGRRIDALADAADRLLSGKID